MRKKLILFTLLFMSVSLGSISFPAHADVDVKIEQVKDGSKSLPQGGIFNLAKRIGGAWWNVGINFFRNILSDRYKNNKDIDFSKLPDWAILECYFFVWYGDFTGMEIDLKNFMKTLGFLEFGQAEKQAEKDQKVVKSVEDGDDSDDDNDDDDGYDTDTKKDTSIPTPPPAPPFSKKK